MDYHWRLERSFYFLFLHLHEESYAWCLEEWRRREKEGGAATSTPFEPLLCRGYWRRTLGIVSRPPLDVWPRRAARRHPRWADLVDPPEAAPLARMGYEGKGTGVLDAGKA